jgi:hypothetical protein
MASRFSTLLCLIVLLAFESYAQPRPQEPFDGPLYYFFPLLTNYPPLQTNMPYGIMQGYIGYDSLARRGDEAIVESIVQNLTWSDTAKYGAKFLYSMVDYDPIRFFQWSYTSPARGTYKSAPAWLRTIFSDRLRKIAPDSLFVAPLLYADYIAHIRVDDTLRKTDTTASFARTVIKVTATVLDTIKGRVLPECIDEPARAKKPGELQAAPRPSCLQFSYALEWLRSHGPPELSGANRTLVDDNGSPLSYEYSLVDENGSPWVKKGAEYVVFLRYLNLRRDTVYNFAELVPVVGWGRNLCLYPVVDGVVSDPYDDFGYGTGLSVDQFKNALRATISSITNP